jgi:hypothetical protein
MKRNRAYIRAQKRKAKDRAYHLLKVIWKDTPVRDEKLWINHMASTHCVPCSCSMCGNSRRYFGAVTIQEIKCEEDMLTQEKDVMEND